LGVSFTRRGFIPNEALILLVSSISLSQSPDFVFLLSLDVSSVLRFSPLLLSSLLLSSRLSSLLLSSSLRRFSSLGFLLSLLFLSSEPRLYQELSNFSCANSLALVLSASFSFSCSFSRSLFFLSFCFHFSVSFLFCTSSSLAFSSSTTALACSSTSNSSSNALILLVSSPDSSNIDLFL